MFRLEQSNVDNSCHFSERKHSFWRMRLLIVQSLVAMELSSRDESECKQRNGCTVSSVEICDLQRGILSSVDGSNSHQLSNRKTVSNRIIFPISNDG